MITVLFACIHNAGRSQMAAAWFNVLSDPSKARAVSAGTDPGPRVHPEVLAAMKEVGVDLSSATPQRLTEELAGAASLLVTMAAARPARGCRGSCGRTGRSPIQEVSRSSRCERSARQSGSA